MSGNGIQRQRETFAYRFAMPVAPYDGPRLGPAWNRGKLNYELAYNWQMPTYYDNYRHIQEGVIDALTNGYAGLTDETWKKLRRRLKKVPDGYGYAEIGKAAQKALRGLGRELATRVVNSEPTQDHLYRGVMMHPDEIAKLVEGHEFHLPVSAFSPSGSHAYGFAGDLRYSPWTSYDKYRYKNGEQGVVFRLKPGAKSTPIPKGISNASDEHVSFGRYRVVGVQPGQQLTDEPTGAAIKDWDKENKKYVYKPITDSWFEPHEITIEHVGLDHPPNPQQRQSNSVYRFADNKYDPSANKLTDRLQNEFTDWWNGLAPDNQYWSPPFNDWNRIEGFLKDKYPEAYRGLDMGMEHAQPLLDQQTGHFGDPVPKRHAPYETGPDAVAKHGYDPKETVAGMLLLHNEAHGYRTDLAQMDHDRLYDIAQKRYQMQRNYEQRQANSRHRTAMPTQYHEDVGQEFKTLYHFTDPQAAQDIWDSRMMKSDDESLPHHAFFTTDPNSEYAKGFGDSVVKVNIPLSYFNSSLFEGWRDDAFDNGEEHWTVPLDDFERNPHWIERPEGYRPAWARNSLIDFRGENLEKKASRLAAVNQEMVDGLNTQFHDWWENTGQHQSGGSVDDFAQMDFMDEDRGPIGHWPNIENFLKEKYPAAHKGLGMGLEAEWSLDGHAKPYPTGPEAIKQHGYDPSEIAAGMLLLHNQSDPLRGDMSQQDQDRLNDIAQKRYQMQRNYENRTAAVVSEEDWRVPDGEEELGQDFGPAAQNLTERLQGEFDQWASDKGIIEHPFERGVWKPDNPRGPIGHWPYIENFLEDNYPAAHRGLQYGMETAQPLMDGQATQQWIDLNGGTYQTGPDAVAQHGYDPKEIAAALLYLHNRSHAFRNTDEWIDQDVDRLFDIFQKRFQMQRNYEQRQANSERTAAGIPRTPHQDLAESHRAHGTVHNSCGRILPGWKMAVADTATQQSRLADTAGWTHHVAMPPSPLAVQGARAYASLKGFSDPHDTNYSQVMQTPERVAQVGRHYDSLPVYSPAAVPHFAAMQKEVNDQYDFLTNRMGINVQAVDHDPYAHVGEMMDDVNNNKTLKVLGSHVTGGHPVFGDTDNDKFRAVHDFFGHAATGRDFDRHGEHATYLAHSRMFSPQAIPALTTETLGQNSSLILNGHFGPNKIGIIPRHLTARIT